MICADTISVARGNRTTLFELTVALSPGEVLAVIGPNGAGKSTLLKALCGDLAPYQGMVEIDGRPISSIPIGELARLRGVLPQHSSLAFPFSVIDVVLMGRHPYNNGNDGEEDRRHALEALRMVDMLHLSDRAYTTLSGGEAQRVQLARVLAQIRDARPGDERYLFLDEPTSSLDLAHQHGILSLAQVLAAEGYGIFVVLHDLNLAAQYADRVLLLKNGRHLALGTPREVLSEELIAEGFGLEVDLLPHPSRDCPLVVTRSVPLPYGGSLFQRQSFVAHTSESKLHSMTMGDNR
jgi:iron complex transport system ATP-binding protein